MRSCASAAHAAEGGRGGRGSKKHPRQGDISARTADRSGPERRCQLTEAEPRQRSSPLYACAARRRSDLFLLVLITLRSVLNIWKLHDVSGENGQL